MPRRDTDDRDLPSPRGDEAPSLERFMEHLAQIAPIAGRPISPESRLIEDLGFDSSAINRLALLFFERYGIAGLSTASLPDDEQLTVEDFFQQCVLDVLGVRLPDA